MRDGLYLLISPKGGIAFKYDYRFNGRRESVTLGSYGPAGLSLAKAREKVLDAKRMIAEGLSPALEKQRAKRRLHHSRWGQTILQMSGLKADPSLDWDQGGRSGRARSSRRSRRRR